MNAKKVATPLADRRRWGQLLANPSLVRAAVEEVLRFDTISVLGIPRFITEDVEDGRQTLPKFGDEPGTDDAELRVRCAERYQSYMADPSQAEQLIEQATAELEAQPCLEPTQCTATMRSSTRASPR